jgi:transketolase
MELPTIFIFTHDAMGDREDGPTHQPVEHLVSLRAIPGLVTLRSGDANEVVEAFRYVMQLRHQPAVLALARQPLPTLDRSKYAPASGVAQGAYVVICSKFVQQRTWSRILHLTANDTSALSQGLRFDDCLEGV